MVFRKARIHGIPHLSSTSWYSTELDFMVFTVFHRARLHGIRLLGIPQARLYGIPQSSTST